MLIQPTSPAPTGAATDGQPINSGYFWPVIDPVAARREMKLDGTVTPNRLRAALIEAIASVNAELAGWQRTRIAGGANQLADVPADRIDGESILIQRWTRAVYCMAVAILNERSTTFDSTDAGIKKGDELTQASDDLRRDARWAISDMQGIGRSCIELI